MDKHRDWKRPVLALVALGALTVAVLAAPAGAHFRPRDEKKHVKKIARRIAKEEATTIVQTTVGPTLFIEETELVRFGPINLTADATAPIGTFGAGSFTLTASCQETGGTLDATIEIEPSKDNSAFQTNEDGDDDFDTGEVGEWAQHVDLSTDLQEINSDEDDDAHAWGPNGTTINSAGNTIVTNPGDVDNTCSFAGAVLVTSPGSA
jgi:hypothetical protein